MRRAALWTALIAGLLATASPAGAKPVVGEFKVTGQTKTLIYHGRPTLLVRSLRVDDVQDVRIRIYCQTRCRRFAGRARKIRVSDSAVRFVGLNWLITGKRTILVTGLRAGYVSRYVRLAAAGRSLTRRGIGCIGKGLNIVPCPEKAASAKPKEPTTAPVVGDAAPAGAVATTTKPAAGAQVVTSRLPETLWLTGPNGLIGYRSPTVTFTSPDTPAHFECALDHQAYASCTSPVSLANLIDGPHSFLVRAVTAAGVDPTPLNLTFTVDTTPPETIITSGPGPESGDETTVTYANPEGDTSFDCLLDELSWTPCNHGSNTMKYLNAGSHTLRVRARDAVGNVDATPAQRTWTTVLPVTDYQCFDDASNSGHYMTAGGTWIQTYFDAIGSKITTINMSILANNDGGDHRATVGLYSNDAGGGAVFETVVSASSGGNVTLSPPLAVNVGQRYWIRVTSIGDLTWYGAGPNGCWIGTISGTSS